LQKKVLKIFKAMCFLEKSKHLEPNMSGAIKFLAKALYYEYKEQNRGSIGEGLSANCSNGFIEALSSS